MAAALHPTLPALAVGAALPPTIAPLHNGNMPQRNNPSQTQFILILVTSLMPMCAIGCHEPARDFRPLPADGEELPILRRIAGTHSHETRAMQVVVRDPAMLARIPLADVSVNFANEMLLIVTLGRVTSDQYSVDITRVWREGGRLRVEVTVTAPPPGAPIAMAGPFCIAVVPRCDLNVADFAVEPPKRTRSWEQSTPPENW